MGVVVGDVRVTRQRVDESWVIERMRELLVPAA